MTAEEPEAGPPAYEQPRQQPMQPQPAPPPPPPQEKGKGMMIAVILVVVIVVIALVVVFVFMGGDSAPSEMTVSEWNSEYATYSSSTDFPSFNNGDVVTIRGTITNMTYMLFTTVELDNVAVNGITFAEDLGSTYNVGDEVLISFDIDNLLGVEMIESLGILDNTNIQMA